LFVIPAEVDAVQAEARPWPEAGALDAHGHAEMAADRIGKALFRPWQEEDQVGQRQGCEQQHASGWQQAAKEATARELWRGCFGGGRWLGHGWAEKVAWWLGSGRVGW